MRKLVILAVAAAFAAVLTAATLGRPQSLKSRTVLVEAVNRPCVAAPVEVVLTPPRPGAFVTVRTGKTVVPAQVRPQGNSLVVTWIVHDLAKGAKRTYEVQFSEKARSVGVPRVRVSRTAANADIMIGDELFARYDTVTGPNKPFFFPVFAPGHKQVVRGLPSAPRPGETTDHPHHQGLWFTHGSVNGEDYWALTQSKTVHAAYRNVTGGPVCGGFTAITNWINKAGARVAEDTRDFLVYEMAGARVMDVSIAVRPVGGPLVFGDTKEGTFGIRLPDSMRLRGGDGHIVNSEGVTDGATWGKRASWVDYVGSVDGATVGVAILEHPTSFRHPTHWHVRDYGLFCANPFGIHDFEQGKPAGTGDHTVQPGGALKLRYRLIFHAGDTNQARIAERWGDYADPPRVTLR